VIDVGRAWREFDRRRGVVSRNRRIGLGSAVAVVAAVAGLVVYPALTGGLAHQAPPNPGGPAGFRPAGRGAGGGGGKAGNQPTPPRAYETAIVARIPLSNVVSVVGDATQTWVLRVAAGAGASGGFSPAAIPVPGAAPTVGQDYQLVRIDPSTSKVMLRLNLGPGPRTVAVGGGTVWLTTPYGQARGQLVRIDPATGNTIMTLHLPVRRCTYVGYTAGLGLRTGRLVANCYRNRPTATDFLRINPVSGQVDWRAGSLAGQIGEVAVAPHSVWYVDNFVRIGALVDADGWTTGVTTDDPAYHGSDTQTQSLVYGAGWIWALGNDQSVARIDPVTGAVTRIYTGQSYDPLGYGGPNVLTVGNSSLWFLDDGYPFSGVLQVSPASGAATSRVPIPPGACGQQPCTQLYSTPGSIWVPTQNQLLRIDTAKLPDTPVFSSGFHRELAAGSPGYASAIRFTGPGGNPGRSFARGGGGAVPLLHVGSAP
jgi:hypothetical protein